LQQTGEATFLGAKITQTLRTGLQTWVFPLPWFCSVFFTKRLFHYKSHSNSIYEILFLEKSDFSTEEKLIFLKKKSDFDQKSDFLEKSDF
jgi:hypothetical protein